MIHHKYPMDTKYAANQLPSITLSWVHSFSEVKKTPKIHKMTTEKNLLYSPTGCLYCFLQCTQSWSFHLNVYEKVEMETILPPSKALPTPPFHPKGGISGIQRMVCFLVSKGVCLIFCGSYAGRTPSTYEPQQGLIVFSVLQQTKQGL